MNLNSVSNHTILANLHTIANLESTDNTIYVYIHIVSNSHFSILQLTMLLHVGGSYYTFFTNYCVHTYIHLTKITSQDSSCLDNCLSFDHDLF